MSSKKKETTTADELVRELRQSYGLGASFFRAAAAHVEMTDTDIQVIDLLEGMGEATAGQLASLMGLTTGTFTAILNRLEKAGLVQRERDPNDGRRVIVKLATDSESKQNIAALLSSLSDTWEALSAEYDDEQKALLLEFLQRSNVLAREEITRLRETPVGNEGIFSAPLGDVESARIVIHGEHVQLRLRAGELSGALYRARFEGPVPNVKVKDGVVTIRYPRRLLLPGTSLEAEVTLSSAIPWEIVFKGGGAEMTAELADLNLLELEASGAGSTFNIEVPEPTGVVPVRLSGFGSEFNVRRPVGVAARVQLKGWGSSVVLDDQTLGGTSRLQTPNYDGADQRYDLETSGSGSQFTITTG